MVGPLLRSSVKMSRCSIVTSRSTPCLRTLARESLTRSGSMSKPHALQAYSLAAVTGMRPSPQPRSQTTSLLVTLASRSSIDHLLWRWLIFDVGYGPFARLAQVDRFEVARTNVDPVLDSSRPVWAGNDRL